MGISKIQPPSRIVKRTNVSLDVRSLAIARILQAEGFSLSSLYRDLLDQIVNEVGEKYGITEARISAKIAEITKEE